MPEELEKGGFILKTHEMLSAHITPQESKNATITGHFDLCLKKLRKRNDYLLLRRRQCERCIKLFGHTRRYIQRTVSNIRITAD